MVVNTYRPNIKMWIRNVYVTKVKDGTALISWAVQIIVNIYV